MFPVNVVGSDGELQYGELERAAQSLDKGTAYGIILDTDTTITEVDGSEGDGGGALGSSQIARALGG